MDSESLWKKTLNEIELEVSEATFESFFKKTKISSIEEDSVSILCPNNGVGFVLQNKYSNLILTTMEKYVGKKIRKIYFKNNGKQTQNEKGMGPLFLAEITNDEKVVRAGLSPKFSFENFAVSVSNQLAHAAMLAVANSPGTLYNPVFLWGGVGVGKTHLLNAVGRKIIESTGKTVFYCSTEDFTNYLVDSIRNKKTDTFRKKFRGIDVLLLDDIQFVSEREFIQEELFHTFNKLQANNKQIVFTSDKPPKSIKKIEKRLVSRFLSGLVIDIQQPDFELKTAILLIKTKEKGVALDIETAKMIAGNIEEIREIEGFIMKLSALQGGGASLKRDIVEKMLTHNETSKPEKYSPREIIRITSKEMGIKLKDIKEDNRKQQVVLARHLIMYLLKTLSNLPYEDIAHLLGKKDHTTVMHGVQKIMNQIPKDDSLRNRIESIRSYLN